MTAVHRTICMIFSAAAFFVLLTAPAIAAQAGAPGLINPNTANENQLQQLPHMTPAIAKDMVLHRPFKGIVELNKFLLDQKLMPAQATEFYRKAFVPIDMNIGTREEFTLIPGVGARMSAEFAEYRPWKSWAQFDKEIGKYVGQQETDRFKQYVFVPVI